MKRGIAVFRFNLISRSLELVDLFTALEGERIAHTRRRLTDVNLDGIAPSVGGYILLGKYKCSYFHPGVLVSGDIPSGEKDFSLTYRDGRLGQFALVAQGRVDMLDFAYAQSVSGAVHAVWLQGPPAYLPVFRKYKYELCYAAKDGRQGWSKPAVLAEESANRREPILGDLSVTCVARNVLASWRAAEGRVYSLMQGERWTGATPARKVVEDIGGADSAKAVSWRCLLWGPEGRLCIGFILNGNLRVYRKEAESWVPVLSVGSAQHPVSLWRASTDSSGRTHILYRQEVEGGNSQLLLIFGN